MEVTQRRALFALLAGHLVRVLLIVTILFLLRERVDPLDPETNVLSLLVGVVLVILFSLIVAAIVTRVILGLLNQAGDAATRKSAIRDCIASMVRMGKHIQDRHLSIIISLALGIASYRVGVGESFAQAMIPLLGLFALYEHAVIRSVRRTFAF